MEKKNYFAVSFNPFNYDAEEIMGMSLEEVREFFKKDTKMCFTIFEGKVSDCDKLVPQGGRCDLDVLCVWFY